VWFGSDRHPQTKSLVYATGQARGHPACLRPSLTANGGERAGPLWPVKGAASRRRLRRWPTRSRLLPTSGGHPGQAKASPGHNSRRAVKQSCAPTGAAGRHHRSSGGDVRACATRT
jgi:hypothetical protein